MFLAAIGVCTLPSICIEAELHQPDWPLENGTTCIDALAPGVFTCIAILFQPLGWERRRIHIMIQN